MELRAILLASAVGAEDVELLESNAVEVQVLSRKRMSDLAAAALQARKRHPRLPLIVSGPERLLRRFERCYPPLVDISIPNATATLVLTALNLSP